MEKPKCSNCGKNEVDTLHYCPYRQEINNDEETLYDLGVNPRVYLWKERDYKDYEIPELQELKPTE